MQNRIPEELIEEVREANDIVDLVSEFVQLQRQGKNFFGLCPFHDEKTPSFSVTEEKQIFYCFGCKKGGNIFTFLMELENYSFNEALQYLAKRAGINLPRLSHQSAQQKLSINDDVLSAYHWLTKLYHHLLKYTKNGKAGYNYLKQRGIDAEHIHLFQLGYAPESDEFTIRFLEKKGITKETLIRNNLFTYYERSQKARDPFRGRIIFPIRNHLGKTIAFSGRALKNQEPKYLNSSENDLFKKNTILYNFDLARSHIRKKNEVLLLEGQMDVIAAYQAGIKNVVATLGTALTYDQARLLKRYADVIVLGYDGDDAGIKATHQAAKILQQVGAQVKVMPLKTGYDPDQIIQEYGAGALQQTLDQSKPYMAFYLEVAKKNYNLSNQGERLQYIQKMIEKLAMINSAIEREYYLRQLSDDFNISFDSLLNEVRKYQRHEKSIKDKRSQNRYTKTIQSVEQEQPLLPAYQNAERRLIAYMLQDVSVAERVQSELGIDFSIDDHKVIVTHLYGFYEEGHQPNVSQFIERIHDQHIKQLVIEISLLTINEQISESEIEDYINFIQSHIEISSLKSSLEKKKREEQHKNPIKAAEIAMEILELKRRKTNLS